MSNPEVLNRELESVKEKFKNSKVRTPDGQLLEVYHFSDQDFDNFSSESSGENYEGDKGFFGSGNYFTDSPNDYQYGKNRYRA